MVPTHERLPRCTKNRGTGVSQHLIRVYWGCLRIGTCLILIAMWHLDRAVQHRNKDQIPSGRNRPLSDSRILYFATLNRPVIRDICTTRGAIPPCPVAFVSWVEASAPFQGATNLPKVTPMMPSYRRPTIQQSGPSRID